MQIITQYVLIALAIIALIIFVTKKEQFRLTPTGGACSSVSECAICPFDAHLNKRACSNKICKCVF
jgi:hypothetical protein